MSRLPVLWLAVVAFVAALWVPRPAGAQPTGPLPQNVGWEPRLGARAPVDVALTDEEGRRARPADYLARGRPVILVLAYYECPMLCSMVLNGLVTALRRTELSPGRDYEVVVVSIDPTDTPERARAKKARYAKLLGHWNAQNAFHFLVGGEEAVREVARGVGFEYEYDPVGKQYGHAAGIVVLTGQGTISHYFYGVDFPPRDLRLGLVEAAQGAIGGAKDKLLLLCFRYDPSRGRYAGLALTSVRAGGVLTVAALGISMLLMSRQRRRALADGSGKETSR